MLSRCGETLAIEICQTEQLSTITEFTGELAGRFDTDPGTYNTIVWAQVDRYRPKWSFLKQHNDSALLSSSATCRFPILPFNAINLSDKLLPSSPLILYLSIFRSFTNYLFSTHGAKYIIQDGWQRFTWH